MHLSKCLDALIGETMGSERVVADGEYSNVETKSNQRQ